MDKKEELKQQLVQELEWVKYRQKMLDLIDEKLLQMKQLAEQAKQQNMTSEELAVLTAKINSLAIQVRALDSESRKTDADKILK